MSGGIVYNNKAAFRSDFPLEISNFIREESKKVKYNSTSGSPGSTATSPNL